MAVKRSVYDPAKAVIDRVVALTGLVALSPLLLAIAAVVKLSDGGPVLYSGKRVGKDGVPFRMHKFRTMVPNADKIGGSSTSGDDPRLTRVGRILRRYKLDELPQLLNVLNGEMSLVGPRPEVPHYVAMYSPQESALLSVRPGITDWASIRFRDEGEILRGAADPEQAYMELIRPEKIRLGLEYVRRRSLATDFAIIGATLRAVAGGRSPRTA